MSLCCCGKPITCFVGPFGHMNRRCGECADKMLACKHDQGTRLQGFDSDGCGYYIWKCNACGAEFVDDLS